MKRITRIIRPIICMAVLLFAMTTAVLGCYCHLQMQLKQETAKHMSNKVGPFLHERQRKSAGNHRKIVLSVTK